MKKLLLSFILIISNLIFAQQDGTNEFESLGGIICYYQKMENTPMTNGLTLFIYIPSEGIKKSDSQGNISIHKVKFDRTYNEQGLMIKEYIPTDYMSNGYKKIFKIGYEETSMEPIVVIELTYTSTSNYTISKYFTKKWAELTNYK